MKGNIIMSFLAAAVLGSAIVGGVASYFSSKSASQAQGDAQSQSIAFQREINAENIKRLEEIAARLQEPGFDIQKLPYQDLKFVGDYLPEAQHAILQISQTAPEVLQYQNIAKYVQEAEPTKIEGNSAAAKEMRATQNEVMSSLKNLAKNGVDEQTQIQSQNALNNVAGTFGAQQASITQGMAQRGQLGSGAELAARLSSAQQGQDTSAKMAMDEKSQAIQRRLQALSSVEGLASKVRSEELGMESQNVGTINDFNQRTASRAQEQGRYEANTLNQQAQAAQQYQQYAAGVANQDIAQNTSIQNQMNMANVNAINSAEQQNLANRQAINNANTGQYNQGMERQQDQFNQTQQQMYNNQLSKANIEAGAANANAQQQLGMNAQTTNFAMQQAANKNAANQGLISAGTTAVISGAQLLNQPQGMVAMKGEGPAKPLADGGSDTTSLSLTDDELKKQKLKGMRTQI